MFYSTSGVSVQGATWNMKHGFKYRLDDQSFHMITELKCVDQSYDDIGLVYDITSSPQAVNTSYQPAKFALYSDTDSILVSARDTWSASQLMPGYTPWVEIFSKNGEQFKFSFGDMELAGFTSKILDYSNLQLPDDSMVTCLQAGMFGYGPYSVGTGIIIDPDTSAYSTDYYDLYRETITWKTADSFMYVGDRYGTYYYTLFLAFDTGINLTVIDPSNVELQLYCEASTFDTSTEGASCRVYNIGGDANASTAREDSLSYTYGTNSYQSLVYKGNIGTGNYTTADPVKMGFLIDYWADNRASDEGWISFEFSPTGPEASDYYKFTDSQYSGTSQDPKLAFDYDLETVQIEGYVNASGTNDTIDGVMVELFLGSNKINGSTTDSSGYYSFTLDDSNNQHTLWAWHVAYQASNQMITPNTNQTVNFILTPESVPAQSVPSGSKNPTAYAEAQSSAWTNETNAYTLGTSYAIGESSWSFINYTNYSWDIPSGVIIKGVYIYIHWKSVLDDSLRVQLYWPDDSNYTVLTACSDWTFATINFTDATTWTPAMVNSADFTVGLQKYTSGGAQSNEDKVLVDWVGTLIEYAEIRAYCCYNFDPNGIKGNNRSIDILFHNYGTISVADFNFKLKIKSFTYTDYDTWVNETFSGTSLNPGSSVWWDITIPMIFEGTTDAAGENWDGWFALNNGIYNITDIYTFGDAWGNTLNKPYFGNFSIISGSIHEVYCVILEDPAFAGNFSTVENWNGTDQSDGYETNSPYEWKYQAWSAMDWFYNTNFSINLEPLIIDSCTFTYNHETLSIEEGYNRSQELLGLEAIWDETSGTSPNNHGFDLLWLLTGQDGYGWPHGGYNRIYIENWQDYWFWEDRLNDGMFHVLQHELGHIYSAIHLDVPPINGTYPEDYVSIMGAEEEGNFSTHLFVPENFNYVYTNVNYFDGPL